MGTYVADEGWARYRARAAQHESLSSEQEAALARAWRAGDERAGARLIECNLRHVVAIAAEYRRWGVPCDDLVQEGSIGLLKAARRFDPTLACSLKAYASYWIRAELRDYVVRGYRIVRLGTTRTERRALRAFRTTNVESAEQLAERSGMPQSRCMLLWPLLSHGDQSLDTAPASGVPARERLRDECGRRP